ncbi:MAG: AAA family ATPase [Bacteroidota bacterium]|nr:AAA family ATPase [Bacteroidota bacterium]
MQKINNIEIKNFKSIRHQKIEGCKRINVFIGYPNVGKSNILEALSLFSIDEPDADFSSFIRMEELTTLFFNGNINEKLEIRLNKRNRIVTSLLESNKIIFVWQMADDDLTFDKMTSDDKIYHMLSYVKAQDKNKVLSWDSIFKRQPRSPEFYGKIENDSLVAIKKYSFEKNINYTSGKYDSLSVPNGENIFDIIYTHADIRKEIANLFESYNLRLLYNSTEKKFSILKNLSDDVIFTIPYELVADTLQRLIFYKTAILTNKDSILLFEEPEAHMFPPYISKLTTDIIFDENNNQYFIATHSPFILSEFIEEAQNDLAIYVVDYDKGETIIKRLTDEQVIEVAQYGIDLFFNLEPYLDKYGEPHSA